MGMDFHGFIHIVLTCLPGDQCSSRKYDFPESKIFDLIHSGFQLSALYPTIDILLALKLIDCEFLKIITLLKFER